MRLTVNCDMYTGLSKLLLVIPVLRTSIAPSLHSPTVPLLVPNKEWRRRILELTVGQSKADPLQMVNPLPVTLQSYITTSPGHVQLLVDSMSCPDPTPATVCKLSEGIDTGGGGGGGGGGDGFGRSTL